MRYPMVALEERSLQLAVGSPHRRQGTAHAPSTSPEMGGEAIAVYDLPTGRKKSILQFRFSFLLPLGKILIQ